MAERIRTFAPAPASEARQTVVGSAPAAPSGIPSIRPSHALQRRAGNAAVTRLLGASHPGDPHERRADAPTPGPASLPTTGPAPFSSLGPGVPLRGRGGVRIHTEPSAARMAAALNARAFTVGSHIMFGRGQFAPGTTAGQRLLGHELGHATTGDRVLLQRQPLPNAEVTSLAPGATSGLADQELADQAEALRAQIAALPAGSTERAALQANLDQIESEQSARGTDQSISDEQIDVNAPPPAIGPTVTFEGYELSPYEPRLRWVLQDRVRVEGFNGARDFYWRFRSEYEYLYQRRAVLDLVSRSDDEGYAAPSRAELASLAGIPELMEREIEPALARVYPEIEEENRLFLEGFEQNARSTAYVLLAESEARVQAEAERYGLSWQDVERSIRVSPIGWGVGGSLVHLAVSEPVLTNQAEASGLVAAAAAITAARERVVRLNLEQRKYVQLRAVRSETTPDGRIPVYEPVIEDLPAYNAKQIEIDEAQRDLDILRAALEGAYPLLAALTSPDSTFALSDFASGNATAAVVAAIIGERLHNIETVRNALADQSLHALRQPAVAAATKARMMIDPGSHLDRLVDERIARYASMETATEILLGLFNTALGILAAVPTGGGSLLAAGAAVGAASISTYMAYDHILDYRLQTAAVGTDFDKARAISQSDPSLFWLALDIVAAGFDIGAAIAAFRSLAPAARAVHDAQSAEAAAEAAEQLRTRGNAIRENLGDTLTARAQGQTGLSAEEVLARFYGREANWTPQLASELFADLFKIPGPLPDQFRTYGDIAAWRTFLRQHSPQEFASLADHELPLGIFARNFERAEGTLKNLGTVHLGPGVEPQIIVHEMLHWAGAEHGSIFELGEFLEEGIVEWLTRSKLGPLEHLNAYEPNVALVQRLADIIGPDVLETTFVHGKWQDLRPALTKYLADEESADIFLELIKQVGPNGMNRDKLDDAIEIILPGESRRPEFATQVEDVSSFTPTPLGPIGSSRITPPDPDLARKIEAILTEGPGNFHPNSISIPPQQVSGPVSTAGKSDVDALMTRVVTGVRAYLQASIMTHPERPFERLTYQTLKEKCGTGRDVSAAILAAELSKQTGLTATIHQFQAQNVFTGAAGVSAKHGFLVATLEQMKPRLIDTTFAQFVEPLSVPVSHSLSTNTDSWFGGSFLHNTAEGRVLAYELISNGFTELDSRNAELYAKALGASESSASTAYLSMIDGLNAHTFSVSNTAFSLTSPNLGIEIHTLQDLGGELQRFIDTLQHTPAYAKLSPTGELIASLRTILADIAGLPEHLWPEP